MKRAIPFLLAALAASAQPTVAPTTESVGTTRGEDHAGYNVMNSFELGYRLRRVDGNLGRYRSDVNFGNGMRLLGSTLAVHSREGHGRYFDQLSLNTVGLGHDPYQNATFRIEKNRLYRYDGMWRRAEYFNPALSVSAGQHAFDTRRRIQDHDITVFPQAGFRLFAGFSRNTQDGPALATVQQFDSRGDEFPLFADVHRTQNEYRLGVEARVRGVKLSIFRGWEKFRESSPQRLISGIGERSNDLTELTRLARSEPYEGSTPHWRVHLTAERDWLAANGRFAYSGGRRDFTFEESATGLDHLGRARDRQIAVSGHGRRPVATAALTLSLFPNSRVTVSNHTAFHHVRMEGDNNYAEINNVTSRFSFLSFRYLGLRTFANQTDLNWRARKWLGLYSGYHYSTRRIRSREQTGEGESASVELVGQTNRIHSGLFGLRLQPTGPLSIRVQAEVGRADRPLFPISERNFHALGARVQYRTRRLLLGASSNASYNTNSVSLSAYSSHARTTSLDASWSARDWFWFDASYSKLDLDTMAGIAYFASGQLVTGDRSIYSSNLHSASLGVRFAVLRRADAYLGYSRTEDTGGSRAAQTFPLTYDSPLARLSIRLHSKLRWNAGYQHYRYREDFTAREDYRAHTGFTSVVWSF
jgi:hypothetical protein